MFRNIPFEIPTKFASGIANGSLTRIGTIIKETGTGKIVAHIQESGLGQNLINSFVGSPFAPLNTLSSLVANVQLSNLKTMVEALRMLQFANLGVAAAGVGVSIVGFALVNKKLQNIESAIDRVSRHIDHHFAELYNIQLRRDLFNLRGAIESVELAQRLKDPRIELNSAAARLTGISSVIRGQLEHLLEKQYFDEALFTLFVRAMLMSDNTRVEAYMLANEMGSAHHAANSVANSYSNLFDELSPSDLLHKGQIIHQRPDDGVASELDEVGLKDMAIGLRDITDSAMTKPLLIEELQRQRISGLEYIKSLGNEKDHPVVLLKTRESWW